MGVNSKAVRHYFLVHSSLKGLLDTTPPGTETRVKEEKEDSDSDIENGLSSDEEKAASSSRIGLNDSSPVRNNGLRETNSIAH